MSKQEDKLNLRIDILYKRIEFINKLHEHKEITDAWHDTRNYFVNEILSLKRQRNRLLGIIRR